MIRAGTTLVALGCALAGCKCEMRDPGRIRDAALTLSDAAVGSAVAATSSPSTPPPTTGRAAAPAMLPEVVGPPAPFHTLRPRMKQADALAALAAAGARRASVTVPRDLAIDKDAELYTTAVPNTVGYVSFHEGRLWSITLVGLEDQPLYGSIQTRWGAGRPAGTAYESQQEYPASALGWEATVTVPSRDEQYGFPRRTYARLHLVAAVTAVAGASIEVTGETFPQLAGLLGKSLDAAERVLPGLRRETADGDEGAPERAAPRQGFARLKTPWGDGPWELVLHTDGQGTITFILLTGATTEKDEARRIALFEALRAAFGELRPEVSEAGRVEIRARSGPTLLRVAEPGTNSWWIALVRR